MFTGLRDHAIVFGASAVAMLAGLMYVTLVPEKMARTRSVRVANLNADLPKPVGRPLLGLENVIHVTPEIYSGSEPEGESGFLSVRTLGVKTIVSVDGTRPNLLLAEQQGLRYVHIPLRYSGIPTEAAELLTSVLRNTPGPWYIHCHHGKHRGPAAAAVAARVGGFLDAEKAGQFLELAGTSHDYPGLWRDACEFQPPELNAQLPVPTAVTEVEPLAAAMASIDRYFDRLQELEIMDLTEQRTREDAVLLMEELREAQRRLGNVYDAEFSKLLGQAENHAAAALRAIREHRFDDLTRELAALKEGCNDCHTKYRNEP